MIVLAPIYTADIRSLMKLISEQNAIIREFRQTGAISRTGQLSAEASFGTSSPRHTLGMTTPLKQQTLSELTASLRSQQNGVCARANPCVRHFGWI